MGIEARNPDAQAIEAAEFARKNGKVVAAAEIAAAGLGLSGMPLLPEEVSEISKDPKQRAVLACLARIYVDSLKSVANQAKFPKNALESLLPASSAIKVIYRNPELAEALRGVSVDHLGRSHDFLPEMKRDEAKTMFAASVLYGKSVSNELILLGERVLIETYARLPKGHPTKSLIGIEIEFSKAARGVMPRIDNLKYDFYLLKRSDLETNPHRVATVASWFIAWGEKFNNIQMLTTGHMAFNQILKVHPGVDFIVENERRKLANQRRRRIVFSYLTPITTNQQNRDALYSNLKR